ncbi:MAG: hypothetical protein ACTSU5_15965 [Promethearchaeota archaeon]
MSTPESDSFDGKAFDVKAKDLLGSVLSGSTRTTRSALRSSWRELARQVWDKIRETQP